MTNIRGAYVCSNPVVIDKCVAIDDVYINLLEYEKDGRLIIRIFDELSDQQRVNINKQIQQEISKYDLISMPECDYSKFKRKRFSEVWENADIG